MRILGNLSGIGSSASTATPFDDSELKDVDKLLKQTDEKLAEADTKLQQSLQTIETKLNTETTERKAGDSFIPFPTTGFYPDKTKVYYYESPVTRKTKFVAPQETYYYDAGIANDRPIQEQTTSRGEKYYNFLELNTQKLEYITEMYDRDRLQININDDKLDLIPIMWVAPFAQEISIAYNTRSPVNEVSLNRGGKVEKLAPRTDPFDRIEIPVEIGDLVIWWHNNSKLNIVIKPNGIDYSAQLQQFTNNIAGLKNEIQRVENDIPVHHAITPADLSMNGEQTEVLLATLNCAKTAWYDILGQFNAEGVDDTWASGKITLNNVSISTASIGDTRNGENIYQSIGTIYISCHKRIKLSENDIIRLYATHATLNNDGQTAKNISLSILEIPDPT